MRSGSPRKRCGSTRCRDPADPDRAGALTDFRQIFDDDVDPGAIGTTGFDVDQINAALAAAFPATGASAGGAAGPLPQPLGQLVAAIRVPAYRRELRRLRPSPLSRMPHEPPAPAPQP